jgi:hypothetical protein
LEVDAEVDKGFSEEESKDSHSSQDLFYNLPVFKLD